jgi:hypothetical protein
MPAFAGITSGLPRSVRRPAAPPIYCGAPPGGGADIFSGSSRAGEEAGVFQLPEASPLSQGSEASLVTRREARGDGGG